MIRELHVSEDDQTKEPKIRKIKKKSGRIGGAGKVPLYAKANRLKLTVYEGKIMGKKSILNKITKRRPCSWRFILLHCACDAVCLATYLNLCAACVRHHVVNWIHINVSFYYYCPEVNRAD